MSDERMQPPEGSEPEGPGWLKAWVPRPGVNFLARRSASYWPTLTAAPSCLCSRGRRSGTGG
jgi:hypothetical protein